MAATASPPAKKLDLYEEVTTKIEAALEAGTIPWRPTWQAPSAMPHNPFSGTTYRGINPFLLELTAQAEGYTDPRWCTIKQADGAGGKVRKGEKSTIVVFWKQLRVKTDETDAKGEPIVKVIPMLRYFRVFNVAQCEGLELEALATPADHDPIKACVDLIDGMPNAPKIGHGGNRAFYHPAMDTVQLPEAGWFGKVEDYYSTAFHELVHATGHESRLNRGDFSRFGDETYSKEELTAEMGAAMLCRVAGILPATVDQSASYIANWLKALKDDRKLLIAAAGRAQKAADYIRDVKAAETAE